MRVTKEVAGENRRKILETAARLFRTRGIDNVSVADLMKAAGFTHGGFYNHFESKADLAAETVRTAFEQLDEITFADAASAPGSLPLMERLALYLSPEHRDDPAGGCPTASLPVDIGRQSVEAQQAFADGLERYVRWMQSADVPSAGTREDAIATLAHMVGAIILSRAVRNGSPGLSDEILNVVRDDRAGRTLSPADHRD